MDRLERDIDMETLGAGNLRVTLETELAERNP